MATIWEFPWHVSLQVIIELQQLSAGFLLEQDRAPPPPPKKKKQKTKNKKQLHQSIPFHALPP